MSVTLNASTSSGLVQTADTSGVITLQNNGTDALTVSSGNLQFNSGYGSVATAYGCRAWVNFNGTGTVAIRASGNVSSITDGGTGLFRVNFSNALPDANYATLVSANSANITNTNDNNVAPTTTSVGLRILSDTSVLNDPPYVYVAIFR